MRSASETAMPFAATHVSSRVAGERPSTRDGTIDAMRGGAIFMVIGIHALHQPLDSSWVIFLDAALRPAVPIFLFLSGYLTAETGRVPIWRRYRAALAPYTIAFVAAYLYMAIHNPGMDHRPAVLAVRFGLGYVFVYYYVFVYLTCTLGLWLIFHRADTASPAGRERLILAFAVSIGAGLIAGSYLEPLLRYFHVPEAAIEEARLRDIPFWFAFVALGALIRLRDAAERLHDIRRLLWALATLAYLVYALVRLYGIGDAASYDSVAFFAYAALFCCALLASRPSGRAFAAIGAASYFIYLWHIFPIMVLRDNTMLASFGAEIQSATSYTVALGASLAGLALIRALDAPRFARWIGA